LPVVPFDIVPVWHQFIVRSERRDQLKAHLKKQGIDTLIHYPIPPHLSEAYQGRLWEKNDFPITSKISDTVLSLPIGPHIEDSEQEWIIESCNAFLW